MCLDSRGLLSEQHVVDDERVRVSVLDDGRPLRIPKKVVEDPDQKRRALGSTGRVGGTVLGLVHSSSTSKSCGPKHFQHATLVKQRQKTTPQASRTRLKDYGNA